MHRFLINRDYARLWYGQAASTVGDFVFDTTLVLWVATVLARGRSWAPAAVSGVLVAVGVAVVLVGPLAGVFVDRWDRWRTLLHTEIVRAALVGALAVLSLLPVSALPVWLWLAAIYTLVFLLNAAGQFFGPARFAVLGEVVSGDADRARAAGIGQATAATAAIIGPPLAAPLLFTAGLQWALLLNALSYVFSYAAIRSVAPPSRALPAEPPPDPAPDGATAGTVRAEFLAGLRYFANNRFLVVLVGIALIAAFGAGALNTLDIFFVTQNLHAAPRLYGLLSMSFGLGAVTGALLAGRSVRHLGARNTTVVGLVAAGLLVIVYARQTQVVPGLVIFGLVGIPIAALNAGLTPQILATVPPHYLGRVLGVFNPLNQLAGMFSVVVSGWLASTALYRFHHTVAGIRLGPIDTIFAGSGLLVLLAGCYAHLALPRAASRRPEVSRTRPAG